MIKPPPGKDNALLAKEINKALAAPRPVRLASFTVSTVPPAASYSGTLIFVSDMSGGAAPAYSDGTDWRRFSNDAVIS